MRKTPSQALTVGHSHVCQVKLNNKIYHDEDEFYAKESTWNFQINYHFKGLHSFLLKAIFCM